MRIKTLYRSFFSRDFNQLIFSPLAEVNKQLVNDFQKRKDDVAF